MNNPYSINQNTMNEPEPSTITPEEIERLQLLSIFNEEVY